MADNEEYRMVSKTLKGLEEVLAGEIEDLGGKRVKVMKRSVEFYGDKELMYRANYWLRTAINVLKPVASFDARSPEELYENAKKVDWMKLFDLGHTISVHSTSYNSTLNHTRYISQKVKDAVADYFRYRFNQRPDVDRFDADIQIHVYINNNRCELSMNSSGNPLFQRGYRQERGIAPLNEVLAAGMISLSGWDKNSNFVDPMCGSGTLAIEAAMMALNLPPLFYRNRFSFMHWSDYSKMLWNSIKEEAFDRQAVFNGVIMASDISPKMIEIARKNLEFTKLHKDIELKQVDIANIKPPEGKGVVVINPPYGERIRTKDITGLYKTIGDALKFKFAGYSAWVISSDKEAVKRIGLKPDRKLQLQNGALDCVFNGYSIFKGSRKDKLKSHEN